MKISWPSLLIVDDARMWLMMSVTIITPYIGDDDDDDDDIII